MPTDHHSFIFEHVLLHNSLICDMTKMIYGHDISIADNLLEQATRYNRMVANYLLLSFLCITEKRTILLFYFLLTTNVNNTKCKKSEIIADILIW